MIHIFITNIQVVCICTKPRDSDTIKMHKSAMEANEQQTFAVLRTTFLQSGKMLTDHAGK
jgi:hypothetical protein